MSQKNRAAALAAAQASQQPIDGQQPVDGATEGTGAAGAAEGADTQEEQLASEQQQTVEDGAAEGAAGSEGSATEGESAPAQTAPAAPVVIDTSLQAAATSSAQVASRGTVAPPRVKSADQEIVQAPSAPIMAKTAAAAPAGPSLQEEMERILDGVPGTDRFAIISIADYCVKADLKRSNDAKTLAKLNVQLWNNISNLINKQDEHFEKLFTCLLRFFSLEGKNALSEIAINRGVEYMALTAPELQGYYNITTLLRLTADPKSRKQVLQSAIDLPKALKNGLSQEGAARVVTYFETH